jgi:GT2 family glycosyltransferase
MHPTTDIIVLVHNRIDVTKKFVQRLFDHTQNFRLIFVDNASTDETPEFLDVGRLLGKWQVIRHDYNLGVICGRNSATKMLESGYFLNIDNDQLVTEGWLQKLHDTMNQGYDIVGTEAWRLIPPGRPRQAIIVHGQPLNCPNDYFPYHKCRRLTEPFTYIGCGGMLIKKEVFEKIGLFDEQFSPAYFEDPDFCFRAIQAGFKLGWCPSCKIEHLAHQTISTQSLFNKGEQFRRSMRLFQQKWTPFIPESRMQNASV